MTGTLLTSVEDGKEIVLAVGAAVFVTDEFLLSEKSAPQPGLPERVLHSALKPGTPVLSLPEICRDNERHGLNVVIVLHEWDRNSVDVDLGREIRIHLVKTFLSDFRGYRLREIVSEGIEEEVRWAVGGGGFVLRDSYDDWYRTRTEPSPRRYLIGITREEALAVESSVLSLLFHYRTPVCGFTPAERRLLQVALTRETDAEIASALGISDSAVKKRWVAIFDRVATRLPDLLAVQGPGRSVPGEVTRGPQKRHKLLAYLGEHAEELRP